MHKLALTPTADTLSLYIVYMSFEIDPKSVGTYLSGICNKLEDFFPDRPLSASSTHDDVLFVAMLYTGFGALLRLGEITQPDNARLRNPRKLSKRSTVFQVQNGYGFILPYHKADRLFEGNNIIVMKRGDFDPLPIFYRYLASRDTAFPFNPWLWVRSDGTVPNRRWFIARLRILEPDPTFAGQSLRAGGATALAEDGVAPHLIQAAVPAPGRNGSVPPVDQSKYSVHR
ncbi:hypothetical protein BDZ89DRAFT_1106849 [Hymenopellis radicata]|nr:hypothetical protein BDZ89DRAFT_1106849 [Hymenopellis radicata]